MKRFIIMICVVVAVAGLWTAGWFYIAQRVGAEVAMLAEADGESVPRVTCEDLQVDGFPFHFAPRCTNAEIVMGDYDITLGQLQGTVLFYRPTHIQFFAAGPLEIADAFTGSRQQVTWSDMRGSVRLDGDRIGRISVLANNIVYADALFGDAVFGEAEHAEIHLVDATGSEGHDGLGAALDYFARIDGLESGPAEIENGTITLDGRLTGLPPMDVWGHPDALRIWQANDGVLSVRAIDAVAQDASLSASGDLHLDELGRLNGVIELTASGIRERLGDMEESQLVDVFLGSPDAQGMHRQSVTARNGTLVVGIIPVFALTPLF
ncbi:DUF2125 domain-containing protein [Pelagibacterium lentulum]|uniref:DUF2125 domain-containing protein n=1 Tax=Pelagibacterium lentulum TaxID=2029865 RepID=A0A916R4Z9_9HYPH|nr:DUF2125 domain-containing protein [Pelagibacterium lentulum]GGA35253.1 hypothetical protein GCM10011499_00690 [Pelagibacterium lentulum]